MFIDTHCHLTDEYFDRTELGAIIARAAGMDVKTLVCPCADPADIPRAIEIAGGDENVFCTLGIHPEFANKPVDIAAVLPDHIFNNPKIVGIGEIGLDYHYGADYKKQQIELFKQQLDVARKHNLPVAIHSREAESDTIAILDGSVTGVMHSFTSSWEMARVMLDRGFFFSANGILTFKNADDLRETFAKIPNDRIVIETDAPLLAPVPYRGKKCEPYMVIEVAKMLAQIKNLKFEDLAVILNENTKKLYPKIKLH